MTGILLIDKEQDWTSSDVVAKLRGVLHERRIGHGGTLDPLATGLLIIMVGRATRASDYIMGHDKEYFASLRLGVTTDTQDITGNILRQENVFVSEEQLKTVSASFIGEISQIPPMYSAIKIGGKKLYEIARKGGEIERKPRKIYIHDLSVVESADQDYHLRVRCSSGTYVRTLCHDIGNALGCGGCMSALRRISVGDYKIEDAHTLNEIIACSKEELEQMILPIDSVFSRYPSCTVEGKNEEKLRNGNSVKVEMENGFYRVYSENREFLLLGNVQNQIMTTEKSFFVPKN